MDPNIETIEPTLEDSSKPKYAPPKIKVLNEAEVLSAFQVTAAGGTMWWSS
jgi:hypothetical protein